MHLLENRIRKLEERMKVNDDDALSMLMQALGPDGKPHAELVDMFEQLGNERVAASDLSDPVERGLARMLLVFAPYDNIFAIEQFRGWVSDRVLAAVYTKAVNWGGGPQRDRIRRLAKVIDERGNVLRGFTLTSNGLVHDHTHSLPRGSAVLPLSAQNRDEQDSADDPRQPLQ